MKSMFIKGIVLSYLILLMSSCNNSEEKSAPVSVDKEQIKREIQARENEFAEIYNSGELKKIGYYADDAITFYQNMPPIKSQAERLEFLKPDLNSDSNKISFKTNEIFASNDGDQVLEIGSYTVVDSTNTIVGSGNYMSLFEKRDGQYVCLRDMSASDMPLDDFDE
ncbi:YybH family protein [Lutimonas sp.]|jgi:ketosteroid isomerase-like protein|uniref:YybH family protein n=1 Tax=Lutimonas sp. TaxID=1872403 RepID=UPI003C760B78